MSLSWGHTNQLSVSSLALVLPRDSPIQLAYQRHKGVSVLVSGGQERGSPGAVHSLSPSFNRRTIPPTPVMRGFSHLDEDFNLQTRERGKREGPSRELPAAHPSEDKKKSSIEQPAKLVTDKMK